MGLEQRFAQFHIRGLCSAFLASLGVLTLTAMPAEERAYAQPAGSTFNADALVHPADGLRAQRLFLWNGLVVLNHSESVDQHAFLELMALGLKPGYLEEQQNGADRAAVFSNRFLQQSNPLWVNGSTWPGRDEFARQDARRAFLTRYGGVLRGMAPKPVFQFAYCIDLDLPTYDDARKGFPLPGIGGLRLHGVPSADGRTGGVAFRADFDWPTSLFWPASEDAAQEALMNVRLHAPRFSPRRVRMMTVFEVSDGTAETLTLGLKLKRIAIYDHALATELHAFDASALSHGAIAKSDPAADPVTALAAPPPGIQSWVFREFHGHPLIEVQQRKRFFDLVRLGAQPQLLDDERIERQVASAYLTAQAASEFVKGNGFSWQGNDEFAVAASRQAFESRYKGQILKLAPKAPFDFYYADQLRVGVYNGAKASFPLAGSFDIVRDIQESGLKAQPDFAMPALEWRIEPDRAPSALRALTDRMVKIVAHVRVEHIDGATGIARFGLKELGLYSMDLRSKIYDFPIRNDRGAYSATDVPAKLAVPSPTPLDGNTICVELLSAAGAATPEAEFQRCWGWIASRDAAFYASGAPAFAPSDARQPFFPRGGSPLTPANREKFLRWAAAYAAGLAESAVSMQPRRDGSGRYPVITGSSPSATGFRKLLESEKLQEDQLVSGPSMGADVAVMFALPNRLSAYATSVPESARQNFREGLTAESRFRIRSAKMAQTDRGSSVLLIGLTPQWTTISASSGLVVATNHFNDVPTLDSGFVATPSAHKAAAGPLALDSSTVDLLTTRAVGAKLSPEAMTHLVSRRWFVENKARAAPIERFFVAGKRQPKPEEAAELRSQFIAWSSDHASAPPARVVLRQPIKLQKGRELSWRDLRCFSGTVDYKLFTSAQQLDAISGFCRAPATPEDGRACIALQAAKVSFASVQGDGCRLGQNMGLGFEDPLTTAFRFRGAMPSPPVEFLGQTKDADIEVTLDITAVSWSRQMPWPSDVLPADMLEAMARKIKLQPPAIQPDREYVTFNVQLVDMNVRDKDGKVLAHAGPPAETEIEKLVAAFHKGAKAAVTPPAAAAPYDPDLIGLRLGMSFSEAESLIRNHMKVGHVFDGIRATDAAKARANAPMTSGKLFVSEDGRQMVAIFDEPPAAKGRITAAWRRVYIPGGAYSSAEIFADIEKKYGAPAGKMGSISLWYRASDRQCHNLFGHNADRRLAQDWTDGGQTPTFKLPNRVEPKGPLLPRALYEPQEAEIKQFEHCGPVVTARLLKAHEPNSPMAELDMTLTDLGRYAATYSESRKLTQEKGGGSPPIKF